MARLRRRDIHAIAFCVVTIPAVFLIVDAVAGSLIAGLIGGALYALWLLTRARMIRVIRRLRGETVGGWENYLHD